MAMGFLPLRCCEPLKTGFESLAKEFWNEKDDYLAIMMH
jgi:hypothetical protein